MFHISYEDFCDLTGEKEIENDIVRSKINEYKLYYDILSDGQKNELISKIYEKINSNTLSLTGDRSKWERGWGENLEDYKSTKSIESLIPKYRGRGLECRYYGRYIKPASDDFEINVYTILQQSIFSKYFQNSNRIYEFGCGTGINLKNVAELYPDKKLYGLDWVKESADTVDLMRTYSNINSYGYVFDMFNPDYHLDINESDGIYTYHALEQLGSNFEEFFKFVLFKKPKIVIHFEPILEFYNENDNFDKVAINFHLHRKFLYNYYTELLRLQDEGKIEILKSHRCQFGSLHQDSSSIIIWSPL